MFFFLCLELYCCTLWTHVLHNVYSCLQVQHQWFKFFDCLLRKALQWNATLSQRGLIKGLIPLITQMNLLNGRSSSNYIRDKRKPFRNQMLPAGCWKITALLWLCFKQHGQPCCFSPCRWVIAGPPMSESNTHLQGTGVSSQWIRHCTVQSLKWTLYREWWKDRVYSTVSGYI